MECLTKSKAERETTFDDLPVCFYCEEKTEDFFYLINDEILCKNCLNKYFRKDVKDYVK